MRRLISSVLSAIALCVGVSSTCLGQARAFVSVETNFPEAVLFADSIRIGSSFGTMVSVPASVRTLRLVPPDVDTWSIAPISRTIEVTPGDTLRTSMDFPYHYRVESIPFDASVHIETGEGLKQIGSTPLLYSSQRPIEGNLLIERPGYVVERVEPGSEIWNRHVVELSPSDDLDPASAQVNWKPPSRHRAWIDYAALGTAVAAGAVAVYYKFKADDLYAQYEETADPSLRGVIKSNDLRSGIAFGVMQAGIGVFAIRLVLR